MVYGAKTVFSPVRQDLLTNDVSIVVSVVDIKDVISKVESMVGDGWQTITKFIDKTELNNNIVHKTGDGFLNYALETAETMHSAYERSCPLVIRSVDVVITEKCTLKCKDC